MQVILHKKKLIILSKAKNIFFGSLLYGIPYIAKDNFCTKNIRTTAGSNILKNYIPCYESKVTQLLSDADAVLLAKANLDELGMGGSGLYSLAGENS